MIDIKVRKKNGILENYNTEKIQDAILASAKKVLSQEDEYFLIEKSKEIANKVTRIIILNTMEQTEVSTEDVHEIVLDTLASDWPVVYTSYSSYRNFRKEVASLFLDAHEASEKVRDDGDKENANKDSDLNSTKQALIANNSMKGYMKTFELDKIWYEAHEQGWIHIHDIAERYLRTQNCCLFNMAGLLKDGFQLNGAKYAEPKHFDSAINVIGDATLFASAQQYGK